MTQPNSFERYQNFHLQKAAASDTSNLSSEHASTGVSATQLVWAVIIMSASAGMLYVIYTRSKPTYRLESKLKN
jgi:hypothetical protein